MTDRLWNGAIGGGAPPVGNVRIPAKPNAVPQAKPSGKDRVGRIFDQTRDPRDIRDEPQPQQSNEQKNGARRQGKSQLQALRSDDLELLPNDARCASCRQPAAFHHFANHPFLWQHDQLTTEDDARRAAAQKLSDEEQTCRRRAGNRCVTCNQPAPYHHVLCGATTKEIVNLERDFPKALSAMRKDRP